jgi:crotonobetainyl-CoA:carnitine CoA-transferase CaiB-like acyl-CoA transferase
VAHRDGLRAEIVGRLRTAPAAQWAARLTEVRVPAGVVNDLAGAFALARSLGLDPIVEVPSGDGTASPVALTRNPIMLSRTPPSYRSAPPRMP